jgi:acetyl-CoA carboxylase carboxyl transferase alpha subunit/acetyl-CoA carboxylase carboxyl transferase beta subunit
MVRSLSDRLSSFFGRTHSPLEEDQGLREYCEACNTVLVDNALYLQYRVCPSCRLHYPLAAREHISLLADPNTFRESHRSIVSLGLPAASQIRRARNRRRTGLTEAAITGRGTVDGMPVMLIALDFRFLGGTMGAVIGEKVSLAFEMATRRKLPVVAVITSGGTGLQDGVLSLMQMAKTSFAVNGLDREKLPFIAVMTNPTTGQVYSSFANLADIILAEPGAFLGLAPSRTQPKVQGEDSQGHIASGVNSSEMHIVHGMIDRVIDREHLKELLSVLLGLISPKQHTATSGTPGENILSKTEDKIGAEQLEELWPATWETVQLSRHSQRPTSMDVIRRSLTNFVELHGDRLYGDDPSVVAGLGYLGTQAVVAIGQEQGHDVTARERHEGRTYPEGFRKAERVMRLASKLQLPLLTFVDTPGPYYGRESEERGLGNAIASTMALMARLPIPTISVVIGEGGSEGALALGVADRILMLENATYSVTSPENAAALLYRDSPSVQKVPQPLKLSAQDCYELGIIDLIVEEPSGGAHRNPGEAALRLKHALEEEMTALLAQSTKRVLRDRYKKFRNMGEYSSHFRVAITKEVSSLQSYVSHRVRLIRRRRRQEESPQLEEGTKED